MANKLLVIGMASLWALVGCEREERELEKLPVTAAETKNPVVASATPSAKPSAPISSAAKARDTFETALGELRVVPIEHGTFRLELGDKVLYVDPAGKELGNDPVPADLVLITDIHGDHYDEGALGRVVEKDTVVIAPAVVAEKYPKATVMKNGEKKQVLGIDIEATPMYNEKRGPEPGKLFHDKGRGNGYLLGVGKTRVYISGDTECILEMRALEHIDIAFVTMNLPYTMPPEEAASCVNVFKPKVVYPFHYRGSDLTEFQKAVTAAGVEVRLRDWYPKSDEG